MALSKDKIRILVNIPKDLKEQVEKMAKDDNRSVSNFIVNLIEKELKKDDIKKI
jgi:metal-responsive CopG/Arc/MetJ family transcriptional regulator